MMFCLSPITLHNSISDDMCKNLAILNPRIKKIIMANPDSEMQDEPFYYQKKNQN